MRRLTKTSAFAGACVCFLLSANPAALAQEADANVLPASPQERRADLVRLSAIMGEAHHIRANCDAQEAEVWRQRMSRLIELEQPTPAQRNAMVQAFNSAYYDAQQSHAGCDRAARERVRNLAGEGRQLTQKLAANL